MTDTKAKLLSHARLKELFAYDPETGLLTRNVAVGSVRAGTVTAGSTDQYGYKKIDVDKCTYLVHRLVWFYMTEKWPDHQIDHLDHDRSNNRWANLREATVAQNNQNAKLSRANTSGIKGVNWCKASQKWRAEVKHNGERTYGYFHSTEEAAEFVKTVREKHHEGYACHA